jgi:hypothetical protein
MYSNQSPMFVQALLKVEEFAAENVICCPSLFDATLDFCSLETTAENHLSLRNRLFPGFSAWGCNRMSGVQAKLGPHWGSVVWECYKYAEGLNPPPPNGGGLEKSLLRKTHCQRSTKRMSGNEIINPSPRGKKYPPSQRAHFRAISARLSVIDDAKVHSAEQLVCRRHRRDECHILFIFMATTYYLANVVSHDLLDFSQASWQTVLILAYCQSFTTSYSGSFYTIAALRIMTIGAQLRTKVFSMLEIL